MKRKHCPFSPQQEKQCTPATFFCFRFTFIKNQSLRCEILTDQNINFRFKFSMICSRAGWHVAMFAIFFFILVMFLFGCCHIQAAYLRRRCLFRLHFEFGQKAHKTKNPILFVQCEILILPSNEVPFTSFLENVNLIHVCILLHANEKQTKPQHFKALYGTTPLIISVLLVRRVEYASRLSKPNPFTLEIDILMISLA